jgi:23S rRNA (adenine2503-C2)-methyltransferase
MSTHEQVEDDPTGGVGAAPTSAELPLTRRRVPPPQHLADLDPAARRAAVVALGQPPFRAEQLARQYFGRFEDDVTAMSDLPADARSTLGAALLPALLDPVQVLEADGGATQKMLWRLHDGVLVESVVMRYGAPARVPGAASVGLGSEADDADASPARPARVTVCVSSQAGCGMGCPFCATGQLGLTRNLSTAEIVEQVVAANRALRRASPGEAGRVSNVVFMGMGEPLANYRAVVTAVRRLTEPVPAGMGMSVRGVTVSTVGLVPRMTELAGEGLPVTLALSLHAPDDELRDELVPVNQRWPVAEVLDAARATFERTGRRVSIEYALIRDVNDQAWRADLLGRLLTARGRGWVHVNPIPLNPTPGSRWTASRPQDEAAFVAALRARGVPTTVRDTRGRDIDGACGQLAAAVG